MKLIRAKCTLGNYWTDPDIKNDKRIKKITPRVILLHQTGFSNWRYLTESETLSFELEHSTTFYYSGEGFEYLRKALGVKFGKKLEELADKLVSQEQTGLRDVSKWDNAGKVVEDLLTKYMHLGTELCNKQ